MIYSTIKMIWNHVNWVKIYALEHFTTNSSEVYESTEIKQLPKVSRLASLFRMFVVFNLIYPSSTSHRLFYLVMWSKWRSLKREQTEAIYSELAMSSHHLLRLAKTWRQAEGWKSFIAKERVKAACVLWLKAVGKMEVSSLEAGHIMRLVWRAYLTFFVQSWFESNGKNRKVGSHWPSPDTSGPEVFCRDVVWLPGLPDQSSVVIYGLIIISLHV